MRNEIRACLALTELRVDDVPDEVVATIRSRATREWPRDFQMQLYLTRGDLDAFRWLEQFSAPNLTPEALRQIRRLAAAEWPRDFGMQKYTFERMINSEQKLASLDALVAASTGAQSAVPSTSPRTHPITRSPTETAPGQVQLKDGPDADHGSARHGLTTAHSSNSAEQVHPSCSTAPAGRTRRTRELGTSGIGTVSPPNRKDAAPPRQLSARSAAVARQSHSHRQRSSEPFILQFMHIVFIVIFAGMVLTPCVAFFVR